MGRRGMMETAQPLFASQPILGGHHTVARSHAELSIIQYLKQSIMLHKHHTLHCIILQKQANPRRPPHCCSLSKAEQGTLLQSITFCSLRKAERHVVLAEHYAFFKQTNLQRPSHCCSLSKAEHSNAEHFIEQAPCSAHVSLSKA